MPGGRSAGELPCLRSEGPPGAFRKLHSISPFQKGKMACNPPYATQGPALGA